MHFSPVNEPRAAARAGLSTSGTPRQFSRAKRCNVPLHRAHIYACMHARRTHLYEPRDELDERRQDRGVTDLLDDKDGERRLVPGEPLRGWILDGPAKLSLFRS